MFLLLLQLLIFLILSINILLLTPWKRARQIIAIIASIFLGLQALSVYMGANIIDLKFFVHFNYNDVSILAKEFIIEGIIFITLMVVIQRLMLWVDSKLREKIKPFVLIPALLFSVGLLSFQKGWMFNSIAEIVKMKNIKEKAFSQALTDLGFSTQTFISPENIKAEKGKNVIILSLESLENGYLQDNMASVCPNLRQLSNENNYYIMNQGRGSDWTCASLYTYLTGFPMYFKAYGNEVFQKSAGTKLPGISHVFEAAGYEQFYLLGNANQAGIDDLLKTYQVPFYKQDYFEERFGENSWGVHDYDLFQVGKEKVLELNESEKPFVLYLSTIATHYPDGVYDSRLESVISEKDSELEFMASGVDYLISDFISHLKENNILDNTVFYIFPDHLLMGYGSSVLSKFEKRQLYLITNASEKETGYKNDTNIDQIDLAKIILNGTGITHNMSFLTDLAGEGKRKFIEDRKEDILSLNESGLLKGF